MRNVARSAHAVAVLRYIAEEQSGGKTFSDSLSKKLKELKEFIKILSVLISEDESESDDSDKEKNA